MGPQPAECRLPNCDGGLERRNDRHRPTSEPEKLATRNRAVKNELRHLGALEHRRTAPGGKPAVHHRIFKTSRAGESHQRIEACDERGFESRHVEKRVERAESAVGVAVGDDDPGPFRADAGKGFDLFQGCDVQV